MQDRYGFISLSRAGLDLTASIRRLCFRCSTSQSTYPTYFQGLPLTFLLFGNELTIRDGEGSPQQQLVVGIVFSSKLPSWITRCSFMKLLDCITFVDCI